MAKLLLKNKRAYYDYEILKEYEAGLVLTGGEVKAILAHHITLNGAYATINKEQEAWLLNMQVQKWQFDQTPNYDPLRTRKLLLHKKEILRMKMQQKLEKAVLVALKVQLTHGKIKVVIGVAKPMKKYDKRRRDKERTEKRDLQRLRR